MSSNGITEATPRTTVQAVFPDGRVLEGPKGTTIEAFVRAYTGAKFTALTALVNGHLRELTRAVEADERLEPLDLSTSEGIRVYRRSLAFMMVTAMQELHPEAEVFIDYSVPFGGDFCQIRNRPPFTAAELDAIERHMQSMVKADLPIHRVRMTPGEAKAIFTSRREHDKTRLVDRRSHENFLMYQLRDRLDAFYGYMVPSTGYLPLFALMAADSGFVLRHPHREQPGTLEQPAATAKLHAIFREYGDWLRRLRIEDVGQINETIANGRIRETILVSEALHEHKIASISGQIANRRGSARLILIAGPSSSGKTTFSKRLAIQLLAHGIRPFTLEMDRYFLDRDKTPVDEHGEHDYEALEALDLELLNKDVAALIAGRQIQLPRFNFVAGVREPGPTVQLSDDQVIVAEGIHGLNPRLLPAIPAGTVFRIYISALTQLNVDRHNRVSTTDTRLIRRIVRDAAHRGWTAEDTLGMWEKVRRGEKRNIFPYQENADAMFNSALVYELAALKPLAMPLLLQVRPWSKNSVTARRLLAFLSLTDDIPSSLIPENSILREFTGGSIFEDYLPGKE